MSDYPLVSIIIRTVDRPDMLVEAIESISNQEYSNIEIIVVNDGGADLTECISSAPSKVSLYQLQSSVGRCHAANIGLAKSNGKYIGFLDDDDILYPNHVQSLASALEENEQYIAAYSDTTKAMQEKDGNGKYITINLVPQLCMDYDRKELLKDNYIPILCMLFRADKVSDIRFDPNFDVIEDWDFWLQLSSKGDFIHIDQNTSEYRVRDDGTNTTGRNHFIWSYCNMMIRAKNGLALDHGRKRNNLLWK